MSFRSHWSTLGLSGQFHGSLPHGHPGPRDRSAALEALHRERLSYDAQGLLPHL